MTTSTDATSTPDFSAGTEFKPSSVSARERRAREYTDEMIDHFIEKFTDKNFFPENSEALVFALLPQLVEWPADLQLQVKNEHDDVTTTYLKGNDPDVIKDSISVTQDRYGAYVSSATNDEESLFKEIFDQLAVGSTLGFGGDFIGASTTAGRIVTLREQLVGLLQSERASVFEAMLADDNQIKCDVSIINANRFLPLWRQQTYDELFVRDHLAKLNPEIPIERLDTLLERFPLSEAQEYEFFKSDTLPETFTTALNKSIEEWRKDRGLDGIFHTRTYNVYSDTLARTFGQRILRDVIGYDLYISEVGEEAQPSLDPDRAAPSIFLHHNGDGTYAVKGLDDNEFDTVGKGTDSFYLGISSVLQPHERAQLGLQSVTDVTRFRKLVGDSAAAASGGWFDTHLPLKVKVEVLPDWLGKASVSDKRDWNSALLNYRQALIEAQAPNVLKLNQYHDPAQLYAYTKNLIRNRLDFDHGLRIDPDEIFIETSATEWVDASGVTIGFWSDNAVPPMVTRPIQVVASRRSIVQLCVDNVGIFDSDYWTTARIVDKDARLIPELGRYYVHGLVRELNVGVSYAAFLKRRLLDSSLGQWVCEKYSQVMDAQMRMDAIEAKMVGDFGYDGSLPEELSHRKYKWVMAVLDRAMDNNSSAEVEGHRIRVHALRLNEFSSHHPDDFIRGTTDLLRKIDGLILDGMLMIAPEARGSVPSVVLYTPNAPDSVCFRQYGSEEEMRTQLFNDPVLRDYLKSRLPAILQDELTEFWVSCTQSGYLNINVEPFTNDNFYIESYNAEVQSVISQIDDLTTTTAEMNWRTAWDVALTFAGLALEFTPFKVRLPIAAMRSIFALSQGVQALSKGDSAYAIHFVQAALLLTDGLPGGKRPRTSRHSILDVKPTRALDKTPEGLTLRTGGVYTGVFEKTNASGVSSFYAQSAGKTFSIRYDAYNATWRVIDPRRPDAYYQLPIRIDAHGQWNYDNVGLHGGAPKKINPVRQDAADRKAFAAADEGAAGPARAVNTAPFRERIAEILTDGVALPTLKKEARRAAKASKNEFTEAEVERAVNDAVDKFKSSTRSVKSHPYGGGGVISFDIALGHSTGRGLWRVLLLKVEFKDGHPAMLVFFKVDDHSIKVGTTFPKLKLKNRAALDDYYK